MSKMTQNKRALSYVRRIVESSNMDKEAKEIVAHINSLILSDSKKPLTFEEKNDILNEAKQIILDRENEDINLILDSIDNSAILDVISNILSDLREGSK